MKATVELGLRTREVYKLFERKINNDVLFIHALLHKFNKIHAHCRKDENAGNTILIKSEQQLLEGIQSFSEKINQYEQLLQRKQEFHQKKIGFVIQFRPSLVIANHLGGVLVNFIDTYDRLVACIKLLHLAGCFSNDSDCYFHIRNTQNSANRLLSAVLLMPLSHINTAA
ncbi:hypothetical protein Lsan_2900 [Legionella santicrucis]|uniref:Uncharacterized protein n=1 Tax=Legionella santicrucis TaxID=45074 RepID=A0A0W0YJA7_9GAMM|nr:AcaB family transcriptional regulator [Legionella santicrucis]KTD56740.1 hypothetical protein Lsan_2900 [Legionella santicrucis]